MPFVFHTDLFSVGEQLFEFFGVCVSVCEVFFLQIYGLHELIFKMIQVNAWLLCKSSYLFLSCETSPRPKQN